MTEKRIIIVGAGPTGATAALLLARQGVRSVVIERRESPQDHPAASILNTRTMEIFREIGIELEIRSQCQDVLDRSNITWVTSLAGRQLGKLSALPDCVEEQLSLSPTCMVHFPQHRLEPILWREMQREPLVDLMGSHQCLRVEQSDVGVTVFAKDRAGGEISVTGDYLLACDGADSSIRKSNDIAFEGPLLQDMMGIHFELDLAKYVAHRPSILYWVYNSEVLGVLIAHRLPLEWVLFFPYFPPQQSPNDFDSETIHRMICAAVGVGSLRGLNVHKAQPWQMTSRLASSFRSGRTFLAGDAAHTFPPTGGLGLNTGVQDAHNLAWKLSAVLRGSGSATLLDSYDIERRGVAKVNLQNSTDNYWKMNELIEPVGLKFQHLARLRSVQRSMACKWLPSGVQRWLVEKALQFAMRRLQKFDGNDQAGEELRQQFSDRIPGQVSHYRSLGLDLGFSYQSHLVVGKASRATVLSETEITNYDPILRSGGRLPHVSIRWEGKIASTLDLVPIAGLRLLTSEACKERWESMIQINQEFCKAFADPACISIGPNEADAIDESGRWLQLMGNKILGVWVRPDGHIVWLAHSIPAGFPAPFREIQRSLALEVEPT